MEGITGRQRLPVGPSGLFGGGGGVGVNGFWRIRCYAPCHGGNPRARPGRAGAGLQAAGPGRGGPSRSKVEKWRCPSKPRSGAHGGDRGPDGLSRLRQLLAAFSPWHRARPPAIARSCRPRRAESLCARLGADLPRNAGGAITLEARAWAVRGQRGKVRR